jgi:hypothetical protein
VLYVLGGLAEMYVWQTSVRVREVKAEMSRRGLHNGLPPYGYCNGLCSTCTDLNGPGYCALAVHTGPGTAGLCYTPVLA